MYLQYVPVSELPLLTEYVSRAVRPDTIEAVFGELAYVKKSAAELAKVLNVALPRGQRIQHGGFNRDDGLTRRMHMAGALAAFHRAYSNEVRLCEALLIGYRAYEGIAGHLRNTEGWVRFDRFIHSGLAIIRGGEHKLVACGQCSNQFVFADSHPKCNTCVRSWGAGILRLPLSGQTGVATWDITSSPKKNDTSFPRECEAA